jgi:hypothetical protein
VPITAQHPARTDLCRRARPAAPARRRRSGLLALAVLAVTLAAGCTSDGRPQPGSATATGQPASVSPAPRVLQVGQIGTLPPSPQAPARGPRLVVPAGLVPVPGRFPLGTLIRFQLPVRNDGDAELIIDRLAPG